jgi:basic membrane protein A
MIKNGVETSLADHENLEIDEVCFSDCSVEEIETEISSLADASIYDLIVGTGFEAINAIESAALNHLDQNFALIDSVVNSSNVASLVFKEEEGSFLAGAMAAMVSETKLIGFLGGMNVTLINRFGAGFIHGAKNINQEINVQIYYSPDPENPWNDFDGGKQIAESMFNNGTDIIFAAAGLTGMGVFDAVEEYNVNNESNKVYVIGVDSDQDHLSPGNVLTSVQKRFDLALSYNIDDLINGTWEPGTFRLGLQNNYINISPMKYTQQEANADYNSTHSRIEIIDDYRNQIINGDIEVYENFEEIQIDYESDTLTEEPLDEELNLNIATGAIVLGTSLAGFGVAGWYFAKISQKPVSKKVGLSLTHGTRRVVQNVFGGYTSSYLVIGANFVNREKLDPDLEKQFPAKILKHKFLLHPVRLAMCKMLAENSRMTSSELREELGIPWGDFSNHTRSLRQKNFIYQEDVIVDGSVKQVISLEELGRKAYDELILLLIDFIDKSPLYDQYMDKVFTKSKEDKN